MSDSMQIKLQNDSGGTIRLVHTEASSGDNQSVIQGERDRWIKPPPAQNEAQPIKNGESFDLGTMDYVSWAGSPHFHWVYFSYEDDPSTIVQIGVIQRPTAGVWIQIGPFDTNSKFDYSANQDFMPKGERPELVEYVDMTKVPAQVTVHAPPCESWKYVKKSQPLSVDPANAEAARVALSIIDGALSTLTTACFVVPGMLPGAVPLTAVQALLHLFNSPAGEEQRAKAFGPEDAFTAAKDAIDEASLEALREQMDNASAQFNAKIGGINFLMTSVARRIDEQQTKTGEIVFDESLRVDIKSCFKLFTDITNSDGSFQKGLISCLDAKATSSTTAPPGKMRLALGIAALCMTMNAFLHSFALRSFILAEKNKWRPENIDLDQFNAESLLSYISSKKKYIEKYKIESLATTQRLGDIVCSIDSSAYISPPYSSSTYHAAITDRGLTSAIWGPGMVEAADDAMKTAGFHPAAKFKTGTAYKWLSDKDDENVKRSDLLYKGYVAYASHVRSNVSTDVHTVVTRTLDELVDTSIPYMANRLRPLSPSQTPKLKSTAYSSQAMEKPPVLQFRYIRYGYSFTGPSGTEGDILWQDWPPTELVCKSSKDGDKETFFLPSRFTVTFEKDEFNQRAEALAAKATEKAKAGKQDPIKPVTPAYPTVKRQLYRRLYKTLDKGDTTGAVADQQQVGIILNNSPTDDFDDEVESEIAPKGKP